MNRSFFCFIHIPKCGGLSFDDIFSRNLGDRYQRFPHHLYEGPISSFNLKLYIQETSDRVGAGGHRFSLDLPFGEIEKCDIKAICFVRDPIARIRSEFFYLKTLPGSVGQNPLIRELDYADYLKILLQDQQKRENISQYQTSHLWGNLRLSDDFLNKMMATQKVLLFPLERFDDACLYLEATFPIYFSDTSFVKTNINEKRKKSDMESELELELSPLLLADKKLIDLARQQTSHLISEVFGARELAQARQKFENRCQNRSTLREPIKRLARKIYRVAASW